MPQGPLCKGSRPSCLLQGGQGSCCGVKPVLAPMPGCVSRRAGDAGEEVVGMEWRLGVFSVLLLRLGHVYTLAIGMQSSPEFAPVSICRASASQGVWQLLHFMASLARFPS